VTRGLRVRGKIYARAYVGRNGGGGVCMCTSRPGTRLCTGVVVEEKTIFGRTRGNENTREKVQKTFWRGRVSAYVSREPTGTNRGKKTRHFTSLNLKNVVHPRGETGNNNGNNKQ